ncbi:MAG: hypothetical protein J4F31_10775 [Flavobacteriales bacterium]|nr:hypothetical protein [Flavobacteriales bacterium]
MGDYIDIPDGEGYDDAYFPLLNPEIGGFTVSGSSSLDMVSMNFPPSDRAALLAADGTTASFPAVANSSGGNGYNLSIPTNFVSADASTVTFNLSITNNWPVDLNNVVVNIVSAGNTLAGFTFPTVASGGTGFGTFTVPSSMDNSFEVDIVSLSTPGASFVPIDLSDELDWSLEVEDLFVFQRMGDVIQQTLLDSTAEVDFQFANGEEILILELFDGDLEYNLTSTMERPTEIVVQFLGSFDVNGDPLEAVIPIAVNQPNTGSIDLSGAELRMDQDPSQPHNRLSLGFQFRGAASDGSVVNIDTSQTVEGTLLFNNMEFEYIEGYFGAIEEDLSGTNVELNIDFLDQFTGDFQINDPIVKLITTNGVGAPIRTNFDMVGISASGNSVPLNMPPSDIVYPTLGQAGQNIEGEIVIDKNNSNVVDFLSNIPESIEIDGTVDINPDGNTGNNFIFRESLLKVGLEVDIGLNISANNLVVEDTINATFSIDEDSGLNPETVTLYINVDNGIGLDAVVSLIMEDENGVAIDSVQTQLLEAAQVDGDGYVIANTFRENIVELDEAQTDAFFSSERILVRTSLSTPQNGNQNYVMRTTDNMAIYLAIESKVKILINEN